MKRKLLRSFAVLAMALMCGNAWAERDTSKPVYVPELDVENGTASFDDLYTAVEAVKTYYDSNTETTEYTIELYGETKIHNNTSNSTNYIAINKAITVNIVAKEDNTSIIRGQLNRGKIWFCNNESGTLNIGSDDKQITIKDDGKTQILNSIVTVEKGGNTSLKNIVFDNVILYSNQKSDGTYEKGYLFSNKTGNTTTGKLFLNNVTVKNVSTTNEAIFYSQSSKDNAINIKGYLNFANCTGTFFDIKSRMMMGDGSSVYNNFSATTPITVRFSGTAPTKNSQLIVAKGKNYLDKFILLNEDLGLYTDNNDLRCNQAYTVETKPDANGAATLVLPFESTIPEGVKAYKLTSVSNNIIATEEVSSKLSANTPVLINTGVFY